jgi:tRNA(adenine34) deaminase
MMTLLPVSLPWQACLEEAWSAYCVGCVPVGAAVMDAAGQILSRGRNRIGERQGEANTLYGHSLAHAEVNALACLPADGLDRHSLSLYTTMEPCPLCMGALYMSGVRQLHFAARDAYAGSTNMLGATPYLSRKPVRVFPPSSPELEMLLIALHTEFELQRPVAMTEQLLETWASAVPEGVRLGRSLFRTGELRRMRAEGCRLKSVLELMEHKLQ